MTQKCCISASSVLRCICKLLKSAYRWNEKTLANGRGVSEWTNKKEITMAQPANLPTSSTSPSKQQSKPKPLHAIVRDFLGRPNSPETLAQRCLLQNYASRADKHGRCNPGYELIRKDTSLKHSAVNKANNHFQRLGVLSWLKGWGNKATGVKGQSNLYTLNPEALETRTAEAYLLGIVSTMAAHGVPFPDASTSALGASISACDASTSVLGVSTSARAEPKHPAIEESSLLKVQANIRASIKENAAALLKLNKPLGNLPTGQEQTSSGDSRPVNAAASGVQEAQEPKGMTPSPRLCGAPPFPDIQLPPAGQIKWVPAEGEQAESYWIDSSGRRLDYNNPQHKAAIVRATW